MTSLKNLQIIEENLLYSRKIRDKIGVEV